MNIRALPAPEPVIRFRSIAYAPSWRCLARCLHCFVPRELRDGDEFDPAVAEALILEAPASIRAIELTGGEPFENIERLVWLLKLITKANRLATVVTNGLWTEPVKQGREILDRLAPLGLRGLSVSLDRYHRPRNDPVSVIKVLQHARRLGMAINIRSAGRPPQNTWRMIRESGVLAGQSHPESKFDLENIGEAEMLKSNRSAGPTNSECLAALTPLVFPDGHVFACCQGYALLVKNPALRIGRIQAGKVNKLVARAEGDLLVAALAMLGPGGLYQRAVGRLALPKSVTRCELCLAVLADPARLRRVKMLLSSDRELRKEIVGRYMVFQARYEPDWLPEMGFHD